MSIGVVTIFSVTVLQLKMFDLMVIYYGATEIAGLENDGHSIKG